MFPLLTPHKDMTEGVVLVQAEALQVVVAELAALVKMVLMAVREALESTVIFLEKMSRTAWAVNVEEVIMLEEIIVETVVEVVGGIKMAERAAPV